MRAAALVLSVLAAFFMTSQGYADDAILDAKGCVDAAVFDRDWQKYSNFDERILAQSRSISVQQYQEVQKKIDAVKIEIAKLSVLLERTRDRRPALSDLVDDISLNLSLRKNTGNRLREAF